MSDEIIKVFDALGEKLGIAIDWGQENVYPYIQDLCQRSAHYKLTNSIIALLIWVIVFALSICGIVFIAKKFPKDIDFCYLDDSFIALSILGFIILGVLIVVSLVMSTQNINNICAYAYIPEKALIDMLHSI